MGVGRSNDEKLRFIAKEIDMTEKNVHRLRVCLSGYVRNQERLRRKSLKISDVLRSFANAEAPALATVLDSIAETLRDREKAREIMNARISTMSEQPLIIYDTICGKVKRELKKRENATDKQRKTQLSLDKTLINNSGDRAKINQSQIDLQSATQKVVHSTNLLVESVNKFEVQKRVDLKACLSDMLWNEISFHSKALEALSKVHAEVNMIDLENDLPEIQERIDLMEGNTGSPKRDGSFWGHDESNGRSSMQNSPDKNSFSSRFSRV